jgi:hypothetical protein
MSGNSTSLDLQIHPNGDKIQTKGGRVLSKALFTDSSSSTVTVSSATTTNELAGTYATLQAACDSLSTKQFPRLGVTAVVASGTYAENVEVRNMDSSNESYLYFQGDSRPHAGLAMCHGLPYNIGASSAVPQGRSLLHTDKVSLSAAGAVITVTVSGTGTAPNFSHATALIVAGDKLAVRNTAGTETDYTVVSASGNTITVNTPVTGSLNDRGAFICLLPNRVIRPTSGAALVVDAPCVFDGFTFDGLTTGVDIQTSGRFNPRKCFCRGVSYGISSSQSAVGATSHAVVSSATEGNVFVGAMGAYAQYTNNAWSLLHCTFISRQATGNYALRVDGGGILDVGGSRFLGPIHGSSYCRIAVNTPIHFFATSGQGRSSWGGIMLELENDASIHLTADVYMYTPGAALGTAGYYGVYLNAGRWMTNPNADTVSAIHMDCLGTGLTIPFGSSDGPAIGLAFGNISWTGGNNTWLMDLSSAACSVTIAQMPQTFSVGTSTGMLRALWLARVWIPSANPYVGPGGAGSFFVRSQYGAHVHFNGLVTLSGYFEPVWSNDGGKITFNGGLTVTGIAGGTIVRSDRFAETTFSGALTIAVGAWTGLNASDGGVIRGWAGLTNGAATPLAVGTIQQAKADAIGAYTATQNSGLVVF